jgi:hypothetical protein
VGAELGVGVELGVVVEEEGRVGGGPLGKTTLANAETRASHVRLTPWLTAPKSTVSVSLKHATVFASARPKPVMGFVAASSPMPEESSKPETISTQSTVRSAKA